VTKMSKVHSGEFLTLDMDVWKPVFQERGADKGKNPIVAPNGTIYIGKDFAGCEVRAFRKETMGGAD
jgi:hypothetical protein